jgi:site-specific DNA-methyltransferase (adenine-specific)
MKLLQSDCLEAMKDLRSDTIDCIIIDPPFSGNSSKAKAGKKGRFQNSLIMYDDMTERGFYILMKPVFVECFRLLREGGHFYCFTDWKQLRNMMDCIEMGSLKINNLICWDKTHFGMGAGYRRQEEYIIVASKSHAKAFNLKNVASVIQAKKITPKNRLHPHEKPQDLLEVFIRNSTNEGQEVLDCFMGSGAVGVACKNLNRRFTGIELDEKYFNIAKQRCLTNTLIS